MFVYPPTDHNLVNTGSVPVLQPPPIHCRASFCALKTSLELMRLMSRSRSTRPFLYPLIEEWVTPIEDRYAETITFFGYEYGHGFVYYVPSPEHGGDAG